MTEVLVLELKLFMQCPKNWNCIVKGESIGIGIDPKKVVLPISERLPFGI